MSATFTLEIQLAPNIETLLNKLIAALAPKVGTVVNQFPPQSPAEQAARMRMQQSPAEQAARMRMQQSPAEQAARMRMQQAPAPAPMPQCPATTYAPQQYRPQPGPTPAAPYAMGNAPVVPTAPHAAPIRNPQPTPVNPTQAAPNGIPPTTGAAPAYTNGSNARQTVPVVPMSGPSIAQPAAVPSNPAPVAGAPTYEQDQLARAASALMDAGKQKQLIDLLARFGVQGLTQLPKERYGEFATALRGLGARI